MKKVSIGIIGYGSMGKMLYTKLGADPSLTLRVANRTKEKLTEVPAESVCATNAELAVESDIVFLCVRPSDLKSVLEDIRPVINSDTHIVSLNGSVSFASIGNIITCKTSKAIPSVTAEINRSQTLVCHNALVTPDDRKQLSDILSGIGSVIELPEHEMGMGSELVSCMPGFIASMFDVVCNAAGKHTAIPHDQIVRMVLETLSATSELMLSQGMTFESVVQRVATKGGITQEGTAVVYEQFPATADELFRKTLEKRRLTAEKAEQSFR